MSGPPAFNRLNGGMLLPSRTGNAVGGGGSTSSQSILSSLLVNNSRTTSSLIHPGFPASTVYPASSHLGAAAASFQQQQQQISNHQQHFQQQQLQLQHPNVYGGVNGGHNSRPQFPDMPNPPISSSNHHSPPIVHHLQQQQHLQHSHQRQLILQPPVSNPITVLHPKPRLPLVVQHQQQQQQQQHQNQLQQHQNQPPQLPSLSVIGSGGGFRPPPSLLIEDPRPQPQLTPPPSLSIASLTPPQTVDNGVQCEPRLAAEEAEAPLPETGSPMLSSHSGAVKPPAPGMVAFRLSMSRRRNIADSIVEFERSKASGGSTDAILSGRVEKAKTSGASTSGLTAATSAAANSAPSAKKRKNLTNSLLVRAGAELHLESNRAIRLVHACLQRRIRADIDKMLAGYFESFVQPCLDNIRDCECLDDQLLEQQQQHRFSFYRTVAEDIAAQFSIGGESSIAGQQLLQQQTEGIGSSSPFSAYRLDGDSLSLTGVSVSGRTLVGPDSSFVVGSCVNRCLGLISRGCQRVYDRHRHLFRYLCDTEDKRFLVDRSYLNCSTGARTYLLLLDEVLQLLELPEYRAVSQRSIDRLKSSAFILPARLARKVLPLAAGSATAALSSGAAAAVGSSAGTAAASPANSSLAGGISEPVSPLSVAGISSLSAPSSP